MKKFFGINAVLAAKLTVASVFGVMILAQNNFFTEAGRTNLAEIELGNLALQKAQREDVK